jgi:hypothetical protein
VTGERISGWDRLVAGGMLLASFVPPVKGAGVAGKAAIKGAKAAETAVDVSKLASQTRHVLRYDKVMPALQAVYHQVVKAPITQTIRSFKKQWDDLLDSVRSVQWQPALAGIGPAPQVWMSEAKKEVKETTINIIGKTGDEVVGKSTVNICIPDSKMYQLGKHFEKRGRQMGYNSKKEYDAVAQNFVKTHLNNSEAKIFEGVWNGKGQLNGTKQIVIVYDGKTAIIDKNTGQIIDFYLESELRGLIHLERLR